jgi:hypothetical protein
MVSLSVALVVIGCVLPDIGAEITVSATTEAYAMICTISSDAPLLILLGLEHLLKLGLSPSRPVNFVLISAISFLMAGNSV